MKHGRMVLLVLSSMAAGCGRPNYACDAKIPCPSGGHTYQFCSRDALGGCAYLTDDGKEFACRSCGDCTVSTQSVAQWCTSTGSSTTTTTDSCTAPQFCQGGGKSYQFCSASDGRSRCRYQTSDGQSLSCASCTDCTASASQVSSWCGATTGGTSGGTTGGEQCQTTTCPNGLSTYQFCTNGTTCRYRTSTAQSFYCASCSNCSSATTSITTWCSGGTTGSTGGTTGSTTGGTTGTPMTGCKGLFSCYSRASTDDDIAVCEDNATPTALDLANLYFECLGIECLQNINNDLGVSSCMSGSDTSSTCTQCVQAASAGACADERTACLNNLP